MTISARKLRREFDGIRAAAPNEKQGIADCVNFVNESLGVLERDDEGQLMESVDEYGRPRIASGCFRPEEYSFRELAYAVGGQTFVESFDPGDGGDSMLMEAGPGLDPTAFSNINMYQSLLQGVVSAKVLEARENPAHIGDSLVDVMPTRLDGEKLPGVSGFGKEAGDMNRKPGQPHPRIDFGERWVKTPELEEKAAAIEVTQEAVFYDQTNLVLAQAGKIGEALEYGRERTILRLVAGATNNYNYNDVGYDTYLSAGAWVNDHSNPAVDHNSLDAASNLVDDLTDPETGREIVVLADTLIYDRSKRSKWNQLLRGTEQRTTTAGGVMLSPPPSPQQQENWQEYQSQILRNVLMEDLGLTKEQAREYWFYGAPKKAFKWMEAWPLRVRQASPNEYAMLDRGLVLAMFANYRGQGAVVEPRQMVRNKN